MKPLIVLLISSVIAAIVIRFIFHSEDNMLAARIGMSCMLVFTCIGHFAFSKGMSMMLPKAVPFKKELVIFTGIIELLAAAGLLLNGFYKMTGYWLIIFFVLTLPANIYAAMHKVDYQKGNNEGPGAGYLWFRVPLQLVFIAWVYYSAIRP